MARQGKNKNNTSTKRAMAAVNAAKAQSRKEQLLPPTKVEPMKGKAHHQRKALRDKAGLRTGKYD